MKTLRFGIEIETIGQTRAAVAQAIQTVVGGTVQHVGNPRLLRPLRRRRPRRLPLAGDSRREPQRGPLAAGRSGQPDPER